MKTTKYFRIGMNIVHANVGFAPVFSGKSLNEAKRKSRELQLEDGGSLGDRSVRVAESMNAAKNRAINSAELLA